MPLNRFERRPIAGVKHVEAQKISINVCILALLSSKTDNLYCFLASNKTIDKLNLFINHLLNDPGFNEA